jgi:hypothetical protein
LNAERLYAKRGRRGSLFQGLGGEGRVPVEEIERRGAAVAVVLCGGGAVDREERKGGARGGEETVLILYRE